MEIIGPDVRLYCFEVNLIIVQKNKRKNVPTTNLQILITVLCFLMDEAVNYSGCYISNIVSRNFDRLILNFPHIVDFSIKI